MSSSPRALAAPLQFRFDPALPITARRADIAALLREHPVLIVAGDTGSGKSTQLPQYCLELGRGVDGLIAHTQPRRLAARALATRIAAELASPLGAAVGFRVRFADQQSPATRLVLMTDGLLLAELAADPELSRYDTVIVDEAHERTLNVDLLLGVLKRLTRRRRDLKVIVTSATLDVERIAEFFDRAPVVAVGGRSHPIELRYADPLAATDEPDLPAAVLQACSEILAADGGDVLVFLPGEREIEDVGEVLARDLPAGTTIVPLYSRLAWEQQRKVFERGPGRRVVLATNVAETSITVPGIRAVVDSGLARISRYSPRSRLQRLPIEPISQASAEQRKGRCGRLGPGLCIRLYSEADFSSRAAFTEPEVLRTNLAALLLRLAADGLGEAEMFPFIDPPDPRALGDGYRLLQELGALDGLRRITRLGRAMARLPLDPRLGRALLESKRFRAEAEIIAITAGLSVPDVRIAADAAGTAEPDPLEDPKSEFSSLIKLWRAYRRAREGPRRALRRWCAERGLSLLRLSEWENVHAQVKDRAAELGIVPRDQSASYAAVHRSLLAGFCTMVGWRGADGEYLGTRGVRFHIFPGSPLRRRKPRWIMAANIVETSRIFARRVAEIEPTWIETAAAHLVKREYLEADWDENREEVVARERTSFLGLTLRSDRIVNYGPIAPEESRRIFAREALVYRRLTQRPPWLLENDAALDRAQRIEERLRTRGLVAEPESLADFYATVLPRQVSSGATLEYFTRRMDAKERDGVRLGEAQLFARAPDPALLDQFPEEVMIQGLRTEIEYRFAPGEEEDGLKLRIALLALPGLSRAAVDGAIPGLAPPAIEALLRSLPKEARRLLIPMAATTARFLTAAGRPCSDPEQLAAWLSDAAGVPAALIAFDHRAIARHLTPRYAVIDSQRTLAEGVDLPTLRQRCAAAARAALDRHTRGRFADEWRKFAADSLPESLLLELPTGSLAVYPTLGLGPGARPTHLRVRLEWSADEAARHFACGAAQLARLMLGRQAGELARRCDEDSRLLLAASPYLSGDELGETLLQIAVRRACFGDAAPPRSRAEFERAVECGRGELAANFAAVSAAALQWFTAARAVRALLEDRRARSCTDAAEETRAHLGRLLGVETLRGAADGWLAQLPRYLKAEERRWQRVCTRGGEAAQIFSQIVHWSRRCGGLERRVQDEMRWLAELDELSWWLEEYRVSLYAQELRTLGPVSSARLEERAHAVENWLKR